MYIYFTQIIVFKPCIKKSIDDIIIAEPTILDEIIVINLAQHNVKTENIIAPPPIATNTSRSYIF